MALCYFRAHCVCRDAGRHRSHLGWPGDFHRKSHVRPGHTNNVHLVSLWRAISVWGQMVHCVQCLRQDVHCQRQRQLANYTQHWRVRHRHLQMCCVKRCQPRRVWSETACATRPGSVSTIYVTEMLEKKLLSNQHKQRVNWNDPYDDWVIRNQSITYKAIQYRQDVQSNAFLIKLSNFLFCHISTLLVHEVWPYSQNSQNLIFCLKICPWEEYTSAAYENFCTTDRTIVCRVKSSPLLVGSLLVETSITTIRNFYRASACWRAILI